MSIHTVHLAGRREDPPFMVKRKKQTPTKRTPIERIFRRVMNREMTPEERRILLGPTVKISRLKR